jgi:signal transduction histidine kinase
MGSIRFRLAVVYSSVLFGLAAVAVSIIYIALATQLNNEVMYREHPVTRLTQTATGVIVVEQQTVREEFRTFEHSVNAAALGTLRRFSMSALSALFLCSLGVGWVVAGRALAPIERITAVAEEITATDLSRRIDLGGPHDELRHLADTFDDMLGRIDGAFEEQRRFIHEASHELRNPLAVIRTNLDVTLADPDASDDDLRQTLAVVQRSAERMSQLVDDLLIYARKGTTVRELVPVDLSGMVQEVGGSSACRQSRDRWGCGCRSLRRWPCSAIRWPCAKRSPTCSPTPSGSLRRAPRSR